MSGSLTRSIGTGQIQILSSGLSGGSSASAQVTVLSATTTTYTLTVGKVGSGSVSPASGSYNQGSTVILEAVPASGWVFDRWVIDSNEVKVAQTSITMDSHKNATAYFTQQPKVIVSTVAYLPSGGKNNNNHLNIEVKLVNTSGSPVQGATISIEISNGDWTKTDTGTTNASGVAEFGQFNNVPNGTFITTIINVTYASYLWDNVTPSNSYTK